MLFSAVRALITIVMGLILCLAWILAWLTQLVAIGLLYPFTTPEVRQDVCGSIFRNYNMWLFVFLHPLWYTKILRPFPKVDGSFIGVINHLSNADPWICIRPFWPTDCKWIAKGSLFKLPFAGWCLKNGGDLPVYFTTEKGGWEP